MSKKIQLNKTTYFRNLKKKTTTKIEDELLNCIDILCNRIEKDEEEIVKLRSQIAGVAEMHNNGMAAVGEHLNGVLHPIIADIMSYMPEECREKWATGVDEEKEENKETEEETGGGETMDA